jgi:RNase H-like domain found in reverse transcriptase/Reverse transcriptase (RNA-dependent DNA polymerase)/Integrase zinc binding domain
VKGLVDSGCSGRAFISKKLVQDHKLSTQPTPYPRTLFLADGKTADIITEYVILPVSIGSHNEHCLLFVTNLADDTPVIFGLPWLKRHNPYIDWATMSLTFNSWYCLSHCCTPGLQQPPKAPTIPDPPRSFHDLPVPNEPEISPPSSYKSPYCENAKEEVDNKQRKDAIPLHIESTLTPGQQHYRTYCPAATNGSMPECRALMIPNRLNVKPAPARTVAGVRQKGKPLPKQPLPPLSVPLPQSPSAPQQQFERPDLSDIRMTMATNFLQFCRDPSTKVMKITWDELDHLTEKETNRTTFTLPDLPDATFQNILEGNGKTEQLRKLFPKEFYDFLDECRAPLQLRRISEADIEKFMKDKPDLQKEDLLKLLPPWLSDLYEGFLPRRANELPPHRAWDHKIELMPGKDPPYQKNRPLSPPELHVIRKWLDDNLNKGFIRESRARCAAPLLLAAKPGGGVRICQDYRGLNNVTIKNRYPLPLIRETLDALCNAKVYTKLDIIAAFNKLRIAEGHEWKTAFITRFGLFESLVMPFGLCNAPASFQHYINHTLHDLLDKTCTAYLDDVLVYSANRKNHRNHVREVVQRLIEAGLQIDINKCEFETTKTKYLGLIISPGGIQMDPVKVKTIHNWLPPLNLKDLQKFLGFANFYRRFIRDFSKISAPLNELLKKNVPWHWGNEQQDAFHHLKTAFATAPVLAMFDYTRRTILETDASDWASGGVLSQYDDDGILRPVAYFSSKHSAPECNYEIYDKELLAIIKALEEWRPELQGVPDPFAIVTDHKNLEYFTSTKALSQRQVRWSEFLSQFNFRIVYRPGSRAVRPDALSRKPGDRPAKTDLNDDRIKNRLRTVLPAERFDPDVLQELLQEANRKEDLLAAPIDVILPAMDKPIDDLIDQAYARSDLAITMLSALRDPLVKRWPKALRKELRIPIIDCKVMENRIYYRDKLFAPPDDELRTQILYRTHSSGPAGHPGRVKTLDLIARDYWWPRMSKDVEEYVKACELCVRIKASRVAPPGFLQPLPVPFRAWSDISVDYITPLPVCERDSRRYKHILVVVCRLTKMRHFIPVTGLSAEELADIFINRIYCLHGAPDNIISDRGTQFVSEFWHHLSERLGVRLRHSSSFHPETDGQTERVNSGVEQYLRAFMNFHQDDWVQWLPLAEFAANNVTSETTGVSPFFANYGFNPRLGTEPTKPCPPNLSQTRKRQFYRANVVTDRFERIITQLKALAQQSAARYEKYANELREDAPRYQEGDEVYIDTRNMKTNRPMKKGDDKMAGPYPIKKVYPRACLVDLPPNMKIFPVFHNSLLRPHKQATGLPGQQEINEAESRHLRGRILEREDGADEVVEKWEFEALLDCHNDYGDLQYLVKWKHHAPTWQPATDLKGQDEIILEFHRTHPDKPSPPPWVKAHRQ